MQKISKQLVSGLFGLLLLATALTLLTSFYSQVEAESGLFHEYPTVKNVPTPARVLKFPTNISVGGIAVLDKAYYSLDDISGDITDRSINRKAQGTIAIPPNKFVAFFPNHNFIRSPHLLDALPANSFDFVLFRYMSMDSNEDKLGNPALAYLARFSSIRCLDLEKAEINDQGVKQLAPLVNLEFIALFSTEIDGTFLKSLAGHKALRYVAVNNTGFKSSELRYFTLLPNLECLNISHLRLNDRDIEVLTGCKNLKWLALSSNPDITDGAVKTFALMPKLQSLDLRETRFSNRALESLEKKGIALRGRKKSHLPTGPRKFRGNGGVEEIFAPFSRDRKI